MAERGIKVDHTTIMRFSRGEYRIASVELGGSFGTLSSVRLAAP